MVLFLGAKPLLRLWVSDSIGDAECCPRTSCKAQCSEDAGGPPFQWVFFVRLTRKWQDAAGLSRYLPAALDPSASRTLGQLESAGPDAVPQVRAFGCYKVCTQEP